MKFALPVTPRYALPLVFALVVFDVSVAVGVSLMLNNAADSAHRFRVDEWACQSYSPSRTDTLYIVARCTKAGAAEGGGKP